MIRAQVAFETGVVQVYRVDHPGEQPHHDTGAELRSNYEVAFVENGSFAVTYDRSEWRFAAGDVLLCFPEIPLAYRHTELFPADVCLCLSFDADFVHTVLGDAPPFSMYRPRTGASDATAFTMRRIRNALSAGDSLAVESLAMDAAAVFLSPEAVEQPETPGAHLLYSSRIEQTCQRMKANLADQHPLIELARDAGISPFYFARVFRSLTGLSPHRYLLIARLARAAALIKQGCSVTETAFECGFGNLSHFIRTFKRRFGMPPRHYRTNQTGK